MESTTSADLYRASRERVTTAVRGLGAAGLKRQVPACPDWTVHNLISHLAGVATDFATGNIDGAPEPPWTAVQVEARRAPPEQIQAWNWTTPEHAAMWSVELPRLPQTSVPLTD